MKAAVLLLRLSGLFLLCLSASDATAKGCVGIIHVSLKYANGTVVLLAGSSDYGELPPVVSVTLSEGDSIILNQVVYGNCWGPRSLRITGAPLGDTADYSSPVINSVLPSGMIAQRGSYYVQQLGVDFGYPIHLFIDAEQPPLATGMLFTLPDYSFFGSVAAGDTCSGPCLTAYLLDGQFVRMQPINGGYVQEGGNVVVRYAADGEPLTFDSPATIVPMADFEGYEFSTDGIYLLSFEGPLVTTTGYAYVWISHLPAPRVDMSLTIERADGTSEEVAYLQPYQWELNAVELGPGDSLRIDHHEITDPCGSVRLTAYEGPDWSPAGTNDPLVLDTPSTSAGIRLAAPGSYYLRHLSECGIPTAYARVTINAPTPELDLVISVRHGNGVEEELFRSHVPTDPPPHVEASLGLGDSVRVHYELTGYCGFGQNITIRTSNGPEDATDTDPLLTSGVGSAQDISFRGQARYLIRLYGAGCYTPQEVYLHTTITYLHIPELDLRLEQLHPDGTSPVVLYAVAGGPIAFGAIELAPEDSIKVRRIVQEYPCTGIVLKVYRSESDTATAMDPLFLDQPLEYAGLTFRESGSLLFTLEDTCGAITASAHLSVSEALTTGITTVSDAGFNAFYANDLLLVETKTGGLLEVRNVAGLLVRKEHVAKDARHLAIPFSGEANGVYIATLRSASQVDVTRFVVY